VLNVPHTSSAVTEIKELSGIGVRGIHALPTFTMDLSTWSTNEKVQAHPLEKGLGIVQTNRIHISCQNSF
jgi:hypothetical protein